MSVLDIVSSYYGAWMAGKGDFSTVPLAPDFAFTGPGGQLRHRREFP